MVSGSDAVTREACSDSRQVHVSVYTTGISGFAECQGHSVKLNLYLAKALPSAALSKEHSANNSSPRRLCRVSFVGLPSADTRQSWNRKKPERMGIFTQKNRIFFIDGGPHRPVPTHLRHFSCEFHGYAANAIRTRDLPLCTYLLYHYTTLSLVSGFHFSSQYIILNRV